jgi:hypothetical protein
MSDDLIAFLRARLDEDEAIARGATVGPWRVNDEAFAETIYGPSNEAVVAGGRWGGEAPVFDSTEDAIHIARHDPARVLAEVEAKRELLKLHRSVGRRSTGSGGGIVEDCQICDHFPAQYPCATLRLLALPYVDHPDYRQEWRP